ncbi:MAG: SulP family inorganic anion transporter [Gammaproteobacteria bacterium]|nr:SulP family inorganic anion transporter [Gammaproteobacteria bacterium]
MIPSPLFALIATTVFYLLFMQPGITPVIGEIPTGLPQMIMPTIEIGLLMQMVLSALTLAALGSIDSLLTSLVADSVTRTQHKPDRELIGQGLANSISGLFGGLPGAGATMRTVVNVHAGGRTPISGALHALLLLAVVLGLGGLASDIPRAVLAGILIKVGTDIIDWDYLKRLKQLPRANIVIMVSVLIATVLIDLLVAVGIGMIMTSFLFMQRMSSMQIAGINPVTQSASTNKLSKQEADIIDWAEGRIMLFHLSGPMSFASAKATVRIHAGVVGYDIMVLDLSDVSIIDFSFSRALEDIIVDSQKAGRRIFLVGACGEVEEKLQRFEVTRHIRPGKIYRNRLDALLHAGRLLDEPGKQ